MYWVSGANDHDCGRNRNKRKEIKKYHFEIHGEPSYYQKTEECEVNMSYSVYAYRPKREDRLSIKKLRGDICGNFSFPTITIIK